MEIQLSAQRMILMVNKNGRYLPVYKNFGLLSLCIRLYPGGDNYQMVWLKGDMKVYQKTFDIMYNS